jgi:DNA polymerase III gamma/tau subunit
VRELAREASESDVAQISRVFEILQVAQDEVSKAANPRHAVEVALLRAVHLAPSGSLPELVDRVEALTKGASVPAVGAVVPAGQPKTPEPPRKPPPGWGARVIGSDAAPLRAAPRADPTPPPEIEEPEDRPAPARLDLGSRWQRLIESVRAARKAGAAAALEHAVPIQIDRGGVQIGFRKGAGQAAIVQEARAAIEDAFEKALGFRAPLQIVEQEAAQDDTVAEQRKKQRAAASSGRIALAREHPAVRAAVEVLGGEIEDVRDLGEE